MWVNYLEFSMLHLIYCKNNTENIRLHFLVLLLLWTWLDFIEVQDLQDVDSNNNRSTTYYSHYCCNISFFYFCSPDGHGP